MISALAFLTAMPLRTAPAPTAGTLAWFPAVGAVVGLVVGAVWWAAGEWWPPLVAAGMAVLVDVVLTGALHLDGLADSADGLLPHVDSRERRLAIMHAPDVGAFGVAAVATALLLRWAALASVAPDAWLVVALWCASRSVAALALARGPYVGAGLGAPFAGGLPFTAWVGLGGSLALALTAAGGTGAIALGGLVLGMGAAVLAASRRLGGVTGDVLGAAVVVGETAGLLLASATW